VKHFYVDMTKFRGKSIFYVGMTKCVYISTFYVGMTKFRGKSVFVVLWVKKIKIVSCKPLFYHRILSFLPRPREESVFRETTWIMHRL
jgi:hypothetical protein